MRIGYTGKREEIRGFTTLDLRNINENFKSLWVQQFGDPTQSDGFEIVNIKINNVDNKVSTAINNIEAHKKSYHFTGNYEELNNIPKEFNPAFSMNTISGVNVLKQGRIILLQGEVNIKNNLTTDSIILNLSAPYRALKDTKVVLYTSEGKSFVGTINTNGEVKVKINGEPISAGETIILNNYFIGE